MLRRVPLLHALPESLRIGGGGVLQQNCGRIPQGRIDRGVKIYQILFHRAEKACLVIPLLRQKNQIARLCLNRSLPGGEFDLAM